MTQDSPGRSCPLHYRYAPRALATLPALQAETLYVVGGLYGNVEALLTLEYLLAREDRPATVVFNGDFHWFDTDPESYARIDQGVLRHRALRGNVETEIAGEDDPAGCGCAYPASVSDAEVERSNRIIARLRDTARGSPETRARLGQLPMFACAQVGPLRIGIVHGDAESLSGWQFAHDALTAPENQARCIDGFVQAGVRVFASTHTCLPALKCFSHQGRTLAVINNGAAGMPNFSGTRFGLATRIALRPAPAGLAQYGQTIEGVSIEALRLDYDHAAWTARFLTNWPAGSAAHVSYFDRIQNGPRFALRETGIAA